MNVSAIDKTVRNLKTKVTCWRFFQKVINPKRLFPIIINNINNKNTPSEYSQKGGIFVGLAPLFDLFYLPKMLGC